MPSGSTACPPVTTTCQPPTSKVSEPGRGGAVTLGGGEGVVAGTIICPEGAGGRGGGL